MSPPATIFSFYTGPSIVEQVALRLSQAGLQYVRAGVSRVYFRLHPVWEQAGGGLGEAQRQVNELYPHAGFLVYEA